MRSFDEIAIEGIRSRFFERLVRTNSDCYASYKAYPYIALVSRDKSDGKLKPRDIYKGNAFLNKTFRPLIDRNSGNPFGIQEYNLSPVNEGEEFYPVVDRTSAIVAGPFFGSAEGIKPREDLALRYYGAHLPLFKSDGNTLAQEGNELKGTDIMALVAADFTGEGIELGTPTHIINPADRFRFQKSLQDLLEDYNISSQS